jgi:hypothetical protein
MRSSFAEDGTALEHLFLIELGIPLPGVADQGDLTAFQRMSLYEAARVRSEKEREQVEKEREEAPDVGGRPNAGALAGGGGTVTEHRHFTNASEKTGKTPEQLIQEHKEQNG